MQISFPTTTENYRLEVLVISVPDNLKTIKTQLEREMI